MAGAGSPNGGPINIASFTAILKASSVGSDKVLGLDSQNSDELITMLVSDVGTGGGGAELKADGSIPLTANWDAGSFKITAETLESDVASGTSPLVIASNTVVANLNASLLEGNAASVFATAAAEALNTTHRTSNGSDHTFLDQDVTFGSSPSFNAITAEEIIGIAATDGRALKLTDGSDNGITIQSGGEVGIGVDVVETETPNLTISGFRNLDEKRTLSIGVGVDADDSVSFDGLNAYLFLSPGSTIVAGGSGPSIAARNNNSTAQQIRMHHSGGASFFDYHTGPVNWRAAGSGTAVMTLGQDGEATFNNDNDINGDFNVKGLTDDNLFYVNAGQDAVGIGTAVITTSAILDIDSTAGAVIVPRMTTTQRDALTAANGMILYNTTDNQMQGRINGAWAAM